MLIIIIIKIRKM